MANIVLTSVDNRLIHGVVALSWIPYLNIKKVIIIDDEIYNDPYLSSLQKISTPAGVNSIAINIDKAVYYWQKNQFGSGQVLILFRNINSAYNCYIKGFKYNNLQLGILPVVHGEYKEYNGVKINAYDSYFCEYLSNYVTLYSQYSPEQPKKYLFL